MVSLIRRVYQNYFDWTDLSPKQVHNQIVEICDTFNYEWEFQKDGVVFKVKDCVCKSSTTGQTTPIKDFFFKLKWNRGIETRRMTYTKKQYISGYSHSHVGSNSQGEWNQYYCFGNQDLPSDFFTRLEWLMVIAQTFTQTESTDYRPIFPISNIKQGLSQKHYLTSKDSLFIRNNMDCITGVNISFDGTKLEVTVNEEILDERLNKDNLLSWYNIEDGKYYHINNISVHEVSNVIFTFKGVDYKLRVEDLDEEQIVGTPCGFVKNRFKAYYEEKIFQKWIKKLTEENLPTQ